MFSNISSVLLCKEWNWKRQEWKRAVRSYFIKLSTSRGLVLKWKRGRWWMGIPCWHILKADPIEFAWYEDERKKSRTNPKFFISATGRILWSHLLPQMRKTERRCGETVTFTLSLRCLLAIWEEMWRRQLKYKSGSQWRFMAGITGLGVISTYMVFKAIKPDEIMRGKNVDGNS